MLRPGGRSWPLALPPLVLAAGLALWSLGFGLPFLFRPDEDVMVGRAVRMAAQGSLDPLFANYPPLVFYLLAGVEKAVALAGGGNLHAATGDPSTAYLAARALSATAAVTAVGMTFWAGRQAYGAAAGLVAAALLAAAPLAVRQAHFATTDGVQAALVAGALAAGLRARGARGYAVAGGLAGLAAAAKYSGGLALVFVVVLALAGAAPRRRACLAAVAGAAVAFAVPCLVALWHLPAYVSGLGFLGRNLVGRGRHLPLGWVFHTTVTLPFGLGLGAYAMAVAGALLAAWRRRAVDVALLAFAVAYLGVTGAGHEDFFRYELPLLPALAILAGGLLAAVPGRWVPAAVAAALLLAAPSLYASAETDRLLGTEDTRALAAAWMSANLPPGSAVRAPYYASPFYGPAQVRANLRWVSDPLAASYAQGRYTTRFEVTEGPGPHVRLLASGPPWQAPLPAARHPLFTVAAYSGAPPGGGVYDPLDSFWLPIWGFAGIDRPGPSISIIRSP